METSFFFKIKCLSSELQMTVTYGSDAFRIKKVFFLSISSCEWEAETQAYLMKLRLFIMGSTCHEFFLRSDMTWPSDRSRFRLFFVERSIYTLITFRKSLNAL